MKNTSKRLLSACIAALLLSSCGAQESAESNSKTSSSADTSVTETTAATTTAADSTAETVSETASVEETSSEDTSSEETVEEVAETGGYDTPDELMNGLVDILFEYITEDNKELFTSYIEMYEVNHEVSDKELAKQVSDICAEVANRIYDNCICEFEMKRYSYYLTKEFFEKEAETYTINTIDIDYETYYDYVTDLLIGIRTNDKSLEYNPCYYDDIDKNKILNYEQYPKETFVLWTAPILFDIYNNLYKVYNSVDEIKNNRNIEYTAPMNDSNDGEYQTQIYSKTNGLDPFSISQSEYHYDFNDRIYSPFVQYKDGKYFLCANTLMLDYPRETMVEAAQETNNA